MVLMMKGFRDPCVRPVECREDVALGLGTYFVGEPGECTGLAGSWTSPVGHDRGAVFEVRGEHAVVSGVMGAGSWHGASSLCERHFRAGETGDAESTGLPMCLAGGCSEGGRHTNVLHEIQWVVHDMSRPVTEGKPESVDDLPAVIDWAAYVRDGRAGYGAARACERVSHMGLAVRLPQSRAGMEGPSRERSDAGVVRRGLGRDGAQDQGQVPGVGAGGNAVVSGAGIHVRVCQRRSQPDTGISLRLFLRTCLLLVLGSVSCWFNAVASEFQVNPQVIPKDRQLGCFGEQAAKNALARLIVLQTEYNLPVLKAQDQLAVEIIDLKKEEFKNCFVQIFAIQPYQSGIVLDVEEMGLGSWGDLPPYYFVRATVEYKGKWYSENKSGAPVFAFVSGNVVQKVNPAAE